MQHILFYLYSSAPVHRKDLTCSEIYIHFSVKAALSKLTIAKNAKEIKLDSFHTYLWQKAKHRATVHCEPEVHCMYSNIIIWRHKAKLHLIWNDVAWHSKSLYTKCQKVNAVPAYFIRAETSWLVWACLGNEPLRISSASWRKKNSLVDYSYRIQKKIPLIASLPLV